MVVVHFDKPEGGEQVRRFQVVAATGQPDSFAQHVTSLGPTPGPPEDAGQLAPQLVPGLAHLLVAGTIGVSDDKPSAETGL